MSDSHFVNHQGYMSVQLDWISKTGYSQATSSFFSLHPLSSLTISHQWSQSGNKVEMESEKGIPHKETVNDMLQSVAPWGK